MGSGAWPSRAWSRVTGGSLERCLQKDRLLRTGKSEGCSSQATTLASYGS